MSYARQISYNTIGNVVTLFFQWLIIMIIPKITDFAEAGVFAVAVSVSSIMNQISTFTLNQYQVADGYRNYSENDFAVTRIVTIALSFVCIFPVSLLFGYDGNQILIIVAYTVYRNLINYAYLHMSSMQTMDRLDYAGKCMIVEGIVSFASFIGIYVATDSLLLATAVMALLGGGCFLLIMSLGYRKFTGHIYGLHIRDTKNLGKLLKIGSPLLLSTICPIIITALPKLLLENYWGTEITGVFSTLTSPTIIIPTLATAVFTPFIVYFSKICTEGDMAKLRKKYSIMVGALLAAGVAAFIVSVLLAGPVFELIYGSDIAPYVDYFNILVIGIVLYSIGICGITVLITKNQGLAAGMSSALALVISVVIMLIWVPVAEMDGATWGLMASYGLFGLLISLCVYLLPIRNANP